MPTLYEVLALPSSATRDEIRTAYLTQLARLRSGALPPFLEDLIESAYTTLDYPDRRIEYDLSLATARQQRYRLTNAWVLALKIAQALARRLLSSPRPMRLPSWRSLTSAVAVAGLCCFALAVAYGMGHSAAGPGSPVARRTPTPPTPRADAISEPPKSIPDAPEASSPTPPTNGPPPVVAAVPSAPRDRVPAASYVSAATIESPPAAALPPETPIVGANAVPAIAPTLRLSALSWSRPFTSTNVAARVWGRYCRDSSGGEIFIPVNAPAPSLAC